MTLEGLKPYDIVTPTPDCVKDYPAFVLGQFHIVYDGRLINGLSDYDYYGVDDDDPEVKEGHHLVVFSLTSDVLSEHGAGWLYADSEEFSLVSQTRAKRKVFRS